ncbi:type VII toxin-antitoxin system MntA family adenylyltransferase antitoxin [Natrarchaeobaculum aegyptiacum]|uniref:Polymerase beta nucleotidyltransferase domain-containing protein n=1 Tax=Natrarchaeobaculum aegyptiacum TaxID=745377 RepID=A0A2Z2HRC8_9EURY|nr:nucleotidyltransferase domain-containing protein [Natrarchaeobaculum aegyptiacum]ARS89619.1 hypothetical protein B1756_07625 [Natrarchaeobaculum aegyptiacum]
MSTGSEPHSLEERDLAAMREVIDRYPVTLALLFGSHATGTETAESDVDVAVAFAGDHAPSDRLELRVQLIVDLMEALGRDAIDVVDLDRLDPAVGRSAVTSGTVLAGDQEVLEAYRSQFEQDRPDDDTHETRMRRFDSILDRLEARVDS